MSQPTFNHGEPHPDTVTDYNVSKMGSGKKYLKILPVPVKTDLTIIHVSYLSVDHTMAAAKNKNSTELLRLILKQLLTTIFH